MSGSVVALGDLHKPFHCKKSLEKALTFIQKEKPSVVVQMGDLYDQYAFSKYTRSLNIMTPEEEMTLGRAAAEEMWEEIRRLVPKADLFQIRGNHDDRAMKRLMDKTPEHEHLIRPAIEDLFKFSGVRTIQDSREELFIDGICYIHGHRKHGDHALWNQMSTVVGHTHLGGVVFYNNARGAFWELNCGYLGDKKSPVFGYKAQKKIDRTTNGLGWITEHGPMFVPFD